MRWVLLLLLVPAMAGCADESSDGPAVAPVCEGTLVDGECVKEILPSISWVDAPSTVGAYETASVTWQLDPGTHPKPHSMRNELLAATAAGSGEDPDSYGSSVYRLDHQDFPGGKIFNATWTPKEAGTFYLRAYGIVDGDDLWTEEIAVTVLPVAPTGNVTDITVAQGASVTGEFGPADPALALGDAVRFVNDDVLEHTFTFSETSGIDPVVVPAGETSEPIVFLRPGSYPYESEGPQAMQGTVAVAAP